MTTTKPQTLSQRVRASEARSIQRGAVRMPGGLLPPDAAQALDKLLTAGYAPSKAKVITRALLDAIAQYPRKTKGY